MKKSFAFASAVLVLTALLVSCQTNEFRDDTYVPEDGDFLFSIAGNKATKASDATIKGLTIDLGTDRGTNFFLEETITRLDDVSFCPETKGTPGYTENFNSLYGGFNARVYQIGVSDPYEDDGRFEIVNAEGLIYKRQYGNDLWDEDKGLYFFLRAGEKTGDLDGVSKLRYYPVASGDTTAGAIAFHYDGSGLLTAKSQKDILFTSREVKSETDYNLMVNKNKGVPVLFHHVLTGVKFAIGNDKQDITDNKISIKEVIFTGLSNSGDCLVKPVPEDNYKDNRTNYSSATVSKWSKLGQASADSIRSGLISDTVYYASGQFAESFYAAGNKHNLNDANATQTFWLIPQRMNDNVKLTIKYTFGDATVKTWTVDFGKALASRNNGSGVDWLAGELRTYTIRIDDVNLRITDEVAMTNSQTDTKTGTKSNIVITNTGNTDAYIRAAIVGQWLDPKGRPVFGFTDNLYELHLVASWYQDQFVLPATGENSGRKHGKFAGLPGYDDGTNDPANPIKNWYLCEDGFYYYANVVSPGKATGESGKDSNNNLIHDPLFTSYTVIAPPPITLSGADVDVYFSLEISTQAISAKNLDGSSKAGWQDAWEDATGNRPVPVVVD